MPKNRQLENNGVRPAPHLKWREKGGPKMDSDQPQVTQQVRGRARSVKALTLRAFCSFPLFCHSLFRIQECAKSFQRPVDSSLGLILPRNPASTCAEKERERSGGRVEVNLG